MKNSSRTKHWKSSRQIDIGMIVNHKLSDKSMIHYPVAKRATGHLPKLKNPPPSYQGQNDNRSKISASLMADISAYHVIPSPAIERSPESHLANLKLDDDHDMDKDWVRMQQSAIYRLVFETDPVAPILSVRAGPDRRLFQCARSVLYQSTTIKHIHESSHNFLEEKEGLNFPSISADAFSHVIEHLNRTLLSKSKVDISMFSPYEIPTEYLFEVIQFGLYLDLQRLVEQCSTFIAKKFELIQSFDDLPPPLIKKILKQVNIGDLVLAQHDLIPDLDLSSLWIDKYLKLIKTKDQNGSSPVTPSIEMAKQACMEFFVSEIIHSFAKWGSGIDTKFFTVLDYEGNYIQSLKIQLDTHSERLSFEFWEAILASCANCTSITIHTSQINKALPIVLSAISNQSKMYSVQLTIAAPLYLEVREMSQFTKVPILPLPPRPTSRSKKGLAEHVKFQTEQKFNLQGYAGNNSIQKTNDVPVIYQKALGLSVKYVPAIQSKSTKHLPMSFSYLKTAYVYPFITDLSLANIPLDEIYVQDLLQIFANTSSTFSLTNIDISNTGITGRQLASILEGMVSNKIVASKIKSLALSKIIKEGDDSGPDASKSVSLAIPMLIKLQTLDISFNFVSALGMRQLFDGLTRSTVVSLNISGLNILTTIPLLLNWNQKQGIVELNLSKTQLVPRSFRDLLSSLNKKMKILDLSGNQMDPLVLSALSEWLPASQLVSLNLAGCYGINDLEFLSECKSLKYVNLSDTRCDDIPLFQIADFWRAGQMLGIKHWKLENNQISDQGVYILKDTMKKIQKMVKSPVVFDVAGNPVSIDCAKTLQGRISRFGFEGLLLHLN